MNWGMTLHLLLFPNNALLIHFPLFLGLLLIYSLPFYGKIGLSSVGLFVHLRKLPPWRTVISHTGVLTFLLLQREGGGVFY